MSQSARPVSPGFRSPSERRGRRRPRTSVCKAHGTGERAIREQAAVRAEEVQWDRSVFVIVVEVTDGAVDGAELADQTTSAHGSEQFALHVVRDVEAGLVVCSDLDV